MSRLEGKVALVSGASKCSWPPDEASWLTGEIMLASGRLRQASN